MIHATYLENDSWQDTRLSLSLSLSLSHTHTHTHTLTHSLTLSLSLSLGPLRDVDVIDVNRQDDFTMKMREWTEYYQEPPEARKKILNVISLEFSTTE